MLTKIYRSLGFLAGVVVACLGVRLADAQIVTDGLIAYWPLDEGTVDGKDVKDVIGKNHGTFIAGPKLVAGKVGKALEVDGQSGVDIPGTDALNFGGKKAFSAMAWVKVASKSPVQGVVAGCCGTIVGQRDAESFVLRFDGRNAGQEMELIVNTVGAAWQGDGGFGAPTFKEGEWHHLAGTMDEKNQTIYADGVLVKTMANAGGALKGLRSETDIGKAGDGGFIGVIDEVAIYNRALTEAEIKKNFTANGLAVSPGGKLGATWADLKVLR